MGKSYLIDTNIILEYISNSLPPDIFQIVDALLNEHFNISVINKIEILGHESANLELEEFLNFATEFQLSSDVVEKTIQLRKLKKIKLPDAIIAATAIVNNLVIITGNEKDFKNIENLEYENPYHNQIL
jgi:predicted nucleic acid-binding protein